MNKKEPQHVPSTLVLNPAWLLLCLTSCAQVNDLREGDLLTDSESHNCSFARLHPEGHGWTEWPEAAVFVGPVVLPAFFFAGQVTAQPATQLCHFHSKARPSSAVARPCQALSVMLVALFHLQVQRVVDTGRVTAVQGAVLEQMRSLGLLLAVDLGLLSGAQVSHPEAATEIST